MDLKIIIADDDDISSRLLSILTKNLTRKVIYVESGDKAVVECQNNPDVDLILLDIKLPVMNGIEAAKLIRQFNKNVVIIAQTSLFTIVERERCLSAGCNDFISKPITKHEFESIINKYFDKSFREQ